MTVGITGGLGCGKSTITHLLEARGFRRLDADAIVRDHVLTSDDVMAAIRARFGAAPFNADGQVNRAALAATVFADDAHRVWLEDLTHPKVYAHWRTALAAAPDANWVIE